MALVTPEVATVYRLEVSATGSQTVGVALAAVSGPYNPPGSIMVRLEESEDGENWTTLRDYESYEFPTEGLAVDSEVGFQSGWWYRADTLALGGVQSPAAQLYS